MHGPYTPCRLESSTFFTLHFFATGQLLQVSLSWQQFDIRTANLLLRYMLLVLLVASALLAGFAAKLEMGFDGDGLQPRSDGLQPTSDGLQPIRIIAMETGLFNFWGWQLCTADSVSDGMATLSEPVQKLLTTFQHCIPEKGVCINMCEVKA